MDWSRNENIVIRTIYGPIWFLGNLVQLTTQLSKIKGYRKLYPKFLQDEIKEFGPSRLHEFFSHFFVRFVILKNMCLQTGQRVKRLDKNIFWIFGIYRDLMFLMDHFTDNNEKEKLSEIESIKEIQKIKQSFLLDAFGSEIAKKVALHEHKTVEKYLKRDSKIDEREGIIDNHSILKSDTGSAAQMMSQLFKETTQSEDQYDEPLFRETYNFTVAFTVADDFLDIAEDLEQNSYNVIVSLMKNHEDEYELLTESKQQPEKLNFKWYWHKAPKTLEGIFDIYNFYFDQIQSEDYRQFLKSILSYGINPFKRKLYFKLFP